MARIFVAPNDDADTVRGMGRFAIAAYLNVPVYAAFHEWLGRGEMLADMWRLWKEGDRQAALAAIPDSVVDELIVWGRPRSAASTSSATSTTASPPRPSPSCRSASTASGTSYRRPMRTNSLVSSVSVRRAPAVPREPPVRPGGIPDALGGWRP